jgi:ABC-type multidrug transport system fused ATPase/permease subunit/CRP-like cAMP-binding protein
MALALLAYARRKSERELNEGLTRSLTLRLYSRVLRFSPEFFRNTEIEKINSRALEDTSTVCKVWLDLITSLPLSAVTAVVFGATMVRSNWFLAVVMIPLSLLSGYFVLFDRKVQVVNRRAREDWDGIRAEANELIAATGEIRSHCAFDYGLKSLRTCFERYGVTTVEIGRLSALFQAMDMLASCLQNGFLYWIGASLTLGAGFGFARPMTWGSVIEFAFLTQLFQKPVSDAGTLLLHWRSYNESTRRVLEYLNMPCTFEQQSPQHTLSDGTTIHFRDVGVTATSGVRILGILNARIDPGQHIALCGPAGCGKTTALNLVSRNVEASTGAVELDGIPVENLELGSLAREISFVPQKPVILNTTIRNNIVLGLRRSGDRTIDDDGWPLDIARLGNVNSLGDFDTELLSLVHRVGLDTDVLAKCLDQPLSAVAGRPRPQLCPPELFLAAGQDIRLELSKMTPELVIPFDERRYIPGTIGENIFGPGMCGEQVLSIRVERLWRHFQDRSILGYLMALGQYKVQTERSLTAIALQRAPKLVRFLTNAERLGEIPASSLNSLPRSMTKDMQMLFLQIALENDADLTINRLNWTGFEPEMVQELLLQLRVDFQRTDGDSLANWGAVRDGRLWNDLSIRENMLSGRINRRIHGADLLVDQVIHKSIVEKGLLPYFLLRGLECPVGEDGKFLSGGQKQKIALARALLKRPSILLLDEATSSLDALSQSRIVNLIRGEFRQKTVVSISHRLSTIRDYNQIWVLDRGQIIQQGTFDQLAASPGMFHDLAEQETPERKAAPLVPPRSPTPPTSQQIDLTGRTLQNQLAVCSLFSHMDSDQLAFLERIVRTVNCVPGQILFSKGDPGDELFVILAGEIEFWNRAARELGSQDNAAAKALVTYGAGRSFGEIAIFAGGVRTLTARVKSPSELCVLKRDDLIALMAADPKIALSILQSVTMRMATITAGAAQYNN